MFEMVVNQQTVPVKVTLSKRKTWQLKVTRDGQVELRGPQTFKNEIITDLLKKHQSWIEKQLLKQSQRAIASLKFVDGASLPFWEGDYRLRVNCIPSMKKAVVRIIRDEIQVESGDVSEDTIKKIMTAWYLKQGQFLLTNRLYQLADIFKVSVAQVSVRNQKSRWGSCTGKGGIQLNWRLVLMPPWVRDSILCHELAHRAHLNHSDAFYRQLEQYCPQYRKADEWLKHHGAGLYF